ncbi:DUF1015 domain-containing protein [Feifania hominis]|uniref:DUF1015 domain-containing protein n=1 Tax=Feifania hominis TaxID=2763660 RepID=A0A926DEJ3_9FIRM|nr:DUF1015 domain-containing protein [Feifania hominis]MBC8536392.1 DUF1015 domain-containing protein [Feifania hominis]
MAEIKPFRALRFAPAAGPIDELCCPPYDIISPEQRRGYLSKNLHNIVRLELPDGCYRDAGSNLRQLIERHLLAEDERPGIYIYEEEFSLDGVVRRVKGFLCLTRLEEFERGIVLPHEETLSKAKDDRFQLMSETFCNFSPIYSLYFDEGLETSRLIDALSAGAPQIAFVDEAGVTHRLWPVYDEAALRALEAQFAPRKLYIADGHHRYETALRFRDELRERGLVDGPDHKANFVMMHLTAMENPGLVVLPTHRLCRGLDGFDEQRLLRGLEHAFVTEKKAGLDTLERELAAGDRKCLALYTGGDSYVKLTLRDESFAREAAPGMSGALCMLDVSILHNLILEPLLGIDKANMAAQKNLIYTRSIREAIESVQNGSCNAAFLLNATRVDEIAAVASAGEKMPQKSTYFYPKLITGLVMNKIMDAPQE